MRARTRFHPTSASATGRSLLESERVRSLRSHTIARYKQVLEDYLLPQLGGIKCPMCDRATSDPCLMRMTSKGLSARS